MSGAHGSRQARDPRQAAAWVGLARFACRIAGLAGLLVAATGLVLADPSASPVAAAGKLVSDIASLGSPGAIVFLAGLALAVVAAIAVAVGAAIAFRERGEKKE